MRFGEEAPDFDRLKRQIENRSGQPELYNYFALRPEDDISTTVLKKQKVMNLHKLLREGVVEARKLKLAHPEMKPIEIAKQVLASAEDLEMLDWMRTDLEDYSNHFDMYFDAKLSRGKKHLLPD